MTDLYCVLGWPDEHPERPGFASPLLFTDRPQAFSVAASRATGNAVVTARGPSGAVVPATYAVARVTLIEDDPHDVPDEEDCDADD